jgi:arylsulfatase A-like enzyme
MSQNGISRRDFIRGAGAAGLASAIPGILNAAQERPNIVFVFADQMRFSMMSCMKGVPGAGEDPENVATPNFDRLASSGVLFTQALSNMPVCSACRTALQTGKFTHTTTDRLTDHTYTLPVILKRQGYTNGYIGKWHMSPHERNDRGDDPRQYVKPENRIGWDYFAGFEVAHRYFDGSYFVDNDQMPIRIPKGSYEPAVQTDLALSFMNRNKQNPFTCVLSWGPPHNPYEPPPEFDTHNSEHVRLRPNVPADKETDARETIAEYAGQVESLDFQMGRILDALDEMGMSQNTILCFFSDHGDMLYSQYHQRNESGAGYKRRPWDEAIRIPGILRWPARIPGGQRNDMLIGTVDLSPTLLALADAPAPSDTQGRDLSGCILRRDDPPDAAMLEQVAPGNTAYGSPWRGIRTTQYMYAISGHTKNGGWLLYDLETDPYQMNNLIGNPAYATIEAQMHARLDDWRKKTGDDQDMEKLYLAFQRRPQRDSKDD